MRRSGSTRIGLRRRRLAGSTNSASCSPTRRRSPSARPVSTPCVAMQRLPSSAGCWTRTSSLRSSSSFLIDSQPRGGCGDGAHSAFRGTVVLHCFSSAELVPVAVERGYFVSFAGNVTYPNGAALRSAATTIARDRILVETDSPYLAPVPLRGRPNEPANVVHTLHVVAQARGESFDELAAATDSNATAAFALP